MIYPVPQALRPSVRAPVAPAVVFLPAAPDASTELPPLTMAPMLSTGWAK